MTDWATRWGVAESEGAVLVVRAFLHWKGHATFDAPPAQKGEPDNGDFYLGAEHPEGDRIEVKHRIGRSVDLQFTDADSFPYDTVMVCEDHQFDTKEPTPFMYWNLNPQMTWAYVNLTSHSEQWTRERRRDAAKNRYGWFYFADKSAPMTRFVPLHDIPERYLVEVGYPRSAWDIDS